MKLLRYILESTGGDHHTEFQNRHNVTADDLTVAKALGRAAIVRHKAEHRDSRTQWRIRDTRENPKAFGSHDFYYFE